MTATLSMTSVPTRADRILLEDLFMHATDRSRRVSRAIQAASELFEKDDARPEALTLTRRDLVHLSDAVGSIKSVTSDVCAALAVALVRRTEILRQLHLADERTVAGFTADLTQEQVDELVRPIFEDSGIAADFVPWGERSLNDAPDEADDGDAS